MRSLLKSLHYIAKERLKICSLHTYFEIDLLSHKLLLLCGNVPSSLLMMTNAGLADAMTLGSELLSITVNCSFLSTAVSLVIAMETLLMVAELVKVRVLLRVE